jgi:2-polyprenyl-3-methyl-5-hydroxy-6-metoxy-1,4-benzoquinol methylase
MATSIDIGASRLAVPRRNRLTPIESINPSRPVHQRLLTPERMDDPDLDPALLEPALRGLRRLNALSIAHPLLWRVLRGEARALQRPVRVLDLACAGGDFVLDVAARAQREGIALDLHGCDFNPSSIELAQRRAASQTHRVRFFFHDAIQSPLPGEYDIVTASLFLHHLTDEHAVLVLRRMAEATARLVVVNDLVRSRVNLGLVALASRLLTRSPVVHTDAVLSVRAAFTRPELLALAERAGMPDASLRLGGFGRTMLVWRRSA